MRTYRVDDKHETQQQKTTRLIKKYAAHGLGIDDIQFELRRNYQISAGRDEIKSIVMRSKP